MYKRFVLTVQVAHKMLGALGQAQQGLDADNLTGRRRDRLVFLRKQTQIAQMFVRVLHGQDLPVLLFHLYGSIAHLRAKQKAAAQKSSGLRPLIQLFFCGCGNCHAVHCVCALRNYWISIIVGFGSCFLASALGRCRLRIPFSNLAAMSVGSSSLPT